MFKDLPYPYTSRAQFERSLSTPVGTEWNTRVGFQRGTLPKVVKKVSPDCAIFVFRFCESDVRDCSLVL
jgi:U3 small nucleolar RNA-associated protein 14